MAARSAPTSEASLECGCYRLFVVWGWASVAINNPKHLSLLGPQAAIEDIWRLSPRQEVWKKRAFCCAKLMGSNFWPHMLLNLEAHMLRNLEALA